MRVETPAASRARRRRHDRRLQEAGAELAERPGQHLLHQQQRDEVEQQRRRALRAPAARDGSPSRAPAHSAPNAARADRARRDRRRRTRCRPVQRDRRGAQPAERDLSLRADVDDAGAKADRDPAAGEQIGRRAIERDADLMRRPDRAVRMAAKAASGLWPESATSSADKTSERTAATTMRSRDPVRGDEPARAKARRGSPRASAARPLVMPPARTSKGRSARCRPPRAASRPAKPTVRHHRDAIGDVEHLLEFGGEVEDRRAGLAQRERRSSTKRVAPGSRPQAA